MSAEMLAMFDAPKGTTYEGLLREKAVREGIARYHAEHHSHHQPQQLSAASRQPAAQQPAQSDFNWLMLLLMGILAAWYMYLNQN
jgi:hypothetical protein